MKPAKKVLAILLALLLTAALPFAALAEEDAAPPDGEDIQCTEHVTHDDTCGYREAAAEAPCTFAHPHDDTCGWAEAVEAAACTFTHEHDDTCGYDEATETPCTVEAAHQHTDADGICGYREESPAAPCAVEAAHQHDDDGACGWAAAVEAAPCTHSCEQCAPQGNAPMVPFLLPASLPGSSAQNPATTYAQLVAAVAAANSNPDEDNIYLSAGTFTFTDAVAISESVALYGTDVGETVLMAAPGKRHFTVDAVAEASFIRLALQGPGAVASGPNGGVQSNAAALTFTNCTLENNVYNDGSAFGGAVQTNGDVTMTGCTLSGNSVGQAGIPVSDGGAIYASGNVNLTDCTLVGNSATQHGGAIHANGNVSLTCCTVAGNSTGVNGGGVNAVGTLALNGSLVSGNGGDNEVCAASAGDSGDGTVTASGAFGEYYILGVPTGGLGALLRTDTAGAPLLTANGGKTKTVLPAAGGPAAGAIPVSANWLPILDQRSEDRKKGTVSDIGAVHLGIADTSLVVTNYDTTAESPGSLAAAIKTANALGGGTITFDVDDNNGYAVFFLPKALPVITCPNLTIDGSGYTKKVELYLLAEGFRHFTSAGNLTLKNLLLEGYGIAPSGGVEVAGVATLQGTVVRNCTTKDNGGGVSAGGGARILNGSRIQNCRADTCGGGVWSSVGVAIYQSEVDSCSANFDGGGVYAKNGNVFLFHATVRNCRSENHGGGIASLAFTLENSTIANCSAKFFGGGIYTESSTMHQSMEMFSSTITGCTALLGGGYFHRMEYASVPCTLQIADSTFSYNSAEENSAIRLSNYATSTSEISRSTFVGNKSPLEKASLCIATFEIPLIQCTIVQNEALSTSLNGPSPHRGCLIAGNTGGDVGGFTPTRPGVLSSEYGENNIIGLPPGGTLSDLVQTDADGKVLLADNGSLPATVLPTAGGPAHNALATPYTAKDQLGTACPQGAGAEVGATELTDIAYTTSQGGITTNAAQSETFTVADTNPNNVANPAVTIQGNGIASGTPVGAKDAVITQGSVVVTLRQEWLQTLADGQYTLTLHLLDGAATLPLTINRSAPAQISSSQAASPQTGDSSRTGLWVALLCASLAVLCAGVFIARRRKASVKLN